MIPKHHEFLTHYLACGNQFEAYKKAYPNAEGRSLKTSANRLLRSPGIQAKLQEAQQQVMAGVVTTLQQTTTVQLATIQQKRALLARIISGDYKVRRYIRLGTELQMVEEDVSPFALLRAIDLDTRLEQQEQAILQAQQPEQQKPTKPALGTLEDILDAAKRLPLLRIDRDRLLEKKRLIEETLAAQTHLSPPSAVHNNNTIPLPPVPSETQALETEQPEAPAQSTTPDPWLTYITYDTNTARLPTSDRANVEHWFRNKSPQQQQKLINLHKFK